MYPYKKFTIITFSFFTSQLLFFLLTCYFPTNHYFFVCGHPFLPQMVEQFPNNQDLLHGSLTYTYVRFVLTTFSYITAILSHIRTTKHILELKYSVWLILKVIGNFTNSSALWVIFLLTFYKNTYNINDWTFWCSIICYIRSSDTKKFSKYLQYYTV